MTRPNRERAQQRALELVLGGEIQSFPVDAKGLLSGMEGVKVLSYSEAGALTGHSAYSLSSALPSFSACTLKKANPLRYIVLYNDETSLAHRARQRFSLAHELGHILLDHQRDDPAFEEEANLFAGQLLCPGPLLELFPPRGEMISIAFGISLQAARLALKRPPLPDSLIPLGRAVREKFCPGGQWQDLLTPMQKTALSLWMRRGGDFIL